MLMPTGWLPSKLIGNFLTDEMSTPAGEHLLQEFGTVVIAVGLVFLWRAKEALWSARFHWIMTLYLSLDALIHWVGPDGPIGSLSRGAINSVPFTLMVLLGLLASRSLRRQELPGAA
jgi:predicted acyltransferase